MSTKANLNQSVLAVDDNTYTLRIIKHTLDEAGYQTKTVTSGEAGKALIQEEGLPNLAIVDIHMAPGMSGFEFCHLVHQFSDLPVIMLTAVSDENTVLEGLEIHAEDYIIKPFSPGELVARVKRLLNRMGEFPYHSSPTTYVDARLQIDFLQRLALVEGQPVSLTPTETKLLYILMRYTGDTVSTEYLLRRLWPAEPAFEDRLHVHLHRLRRKIEDKEEPTHHQYILSERGTGYIFQKSDI
jgi:DNA-binding response OmpR family regulator